MQQAETAEQPAKQREERRQSPRFEVDEPASLQLISQGVPMVCQILDLSSGGCRVLTQNRFLAGPMVRVEISFRVRGYIFRLGGVVQWADRRNKLGIRFMEMSERRRQALSEAIVEVEQMAQAKASQGTAQSRAVQDATLVITEQIAARAKANQVAARVTADKQAAERTAAETALTEQLAQKGKPAPSPLSVLAKEPEKAAEPGPAATEPAAPAPRRERRAQSRHEVDTRATILLVRGGSNLGGRILDLSLGGCRIRTDERFPVGIYTRVETEFRLEGLPFRLGGVVQGVHDRQTVGIRFLDVSPRKREQVEQLIAEIQEMREVQGQGTKD